MSSRARFVSPPPPPPPTISCYLFPTAYEYLQKNKLSTNDVELLANALLLHEQLEALDLSENPPVMEPAVHALNRLLVKCVAD